MLEAGCGVAMRVGHCGQLLLLLLLCVSGSAQEPIGAPAACSAGQTYLVLCYIDSSGYLADVQYSNTMRNTPVSTCGTQQWQLESAQLQTIELSGSDFILRFRACGDSGGMRGLVFRTALGAELSCGSPQGSSSSCRSFSSRSTYPLRGFSATCENLNPGQHKHRSQGLVTRVSSIKAACWTPARQSAAQGPCPAGYGVQGGGLPCQVCPVSTYSPGGSAPCKPCATGTTTLTTGQRQCGCFPGYGVYGPVFQDPDVCELCTAGTYSVGGALAPCQPCSNRAFDFLTSAPGSSSIADCTCAAGYGVTPTSPTTCTMCQIGYFSEGPTGPSQLAAAKAARVRAGAAQPRQSSSQMQLGSSIAAHAGAPAPATAALAGVAPRSDSSIQAQLATWSAHTRAPVPAVAASTGASTLRDSSTQVQLATWSAHKGVIPDTAAFAGASTLRDSSIQAQLASLLAPTGAPPPAPAPARSHEPAGPPVQLAAGKIAVGPGSQPNLQQQQQVPILQLPAGSAAAMAPWQRQGAATAAAAARAAGGPRPAQRALQQVDPVFSTPTYNPCTFCGPGCRTDGPGATSPQQCRCVVIEPVSPTPAPPPPPPASPSPPAPPPPPPSPSPPPPPPTSPSPSPVPSPSPSGTQYCVQCDTNKITQIMNNLCRTSADNTFPILGDPLNGPCWVAFPNTVVADWTTSPTNVFTSTQGLVSCSIVRQPGVAGESVLEFTGTPPAGSRCLMPSLHVFVIPNVLTTRGGRTKRGATGHGHHRGVNHPAPEQHNWG